MATGDMRSGGKKFQSTFLPVPPLYISIVSLKKRSNVNGIGLKTYRIGTCGFIESKKKKKSKIENLAKKLGR